MAYRGIALTIAGSDSGGGAGIQADLKTFAAFEVFGTTAITAITAQNSLGVHGVFDIPPEMVEAQIDAVLSDFPVGAAKTGMLSRGETVRAVCDILRRHHFTALVVDPVMIAQSGDALIDDPAIEALKEELFPLTYIVTPNVPEAERLTGLSVEDEEGMEAAAREIAQMGPRGVLVKGGHLPGKDVVDLFLCDGKVTRFTHPRIETENTHGTGCTLSAAITAGISAGADVLAAVDAARRYVRKAMEEGFKGGKGYGCLCHIVKEW